MVKGTVFITGNAGKAAFLAKWLGVELAHQKVELDELQSLDLRKIVEHKVRQAYSIVGGPVLVEDVGLTFHALGGLPGPFIKWFLQELSLQQICNLLGPEDDRSATSVVCYGWFDGERLELFMGELHGSIAKSPRGERGFGFDPIFVPEGSLKTHAEMNEHETERFSLRTTTVYPQLRAFFGSLDA